MREFFKDQRPFSQRWVKRVLTVAAAHLLKTYAILIDRSDPTVRLLNGHLSTAFNRIALCGFLE